MYPDLYTIKNINDFLLDVGYGVYVVHNGDLEDFLFTIGDDSKYKVVVRV